MYLLCLPGGLQGRSGRSLQAWGPHLSCVGVGGPCAFVFHDQQGVMADRRRGSRCLLKLSVYFMFCLSKGVTGTSSNPVSLSLARLLYVHPYGASSRIPRRPPRRTGRKKRKGRTTDLESTLAVSRSTVHSGVLVPSVGSLIPLIFVPPSVTPLRSF